MLCHLGCVTYVVSLLLCQAGTTLLPAAVLPQVVAGELRALGIEGVREGKSGVNFE